MWLITVIFEYGYYYLLQSNLIAPFNKGDLNVISHITLMVAVFGSGIAYYHSFSNSQNRRFKKNLKHAVELNKDRIRRAEPFDLPELNLLELTVMVEEKTEKGFLGDAGVSYLFRTNQGLLLYDVGFGPERPALAHNASKMGI